MVIIIITRNICQAAEYRNRLEERGMSFDLVLQNYDALYASAQMIDRPYILGPPLHSETLALTPCIRM